MNRIFKFRFGSENDIEALTSDFIWFADIESLNDPYEGYARFNSEGVSDTLREQFLASVYSMEPDQSVAPHEEVAQKKVALGPKFAEHIDSKAIESAKNYYKNHRYDYKVLSVSLQKDSHDFPAPLNNMLMWSHYANGFKGFCIEFDVERLVSTIVDRNAVQIGTSKIKYATDGKLPTVNLKTFMEAQISGGLDSSFEILTSFTKKEQSWSYENELRLISEMRGKHYYGSECVKAVYIAEKMPLEKRQTLLSIIANKPNQIDVFEVRLHPEEYKFGFFRIDT
ncbi:DUF2971 domain-containing protein [Vibrio harveyi]|uniref:DUF2971 domain-containing protein n=1 Tax=Vibrio harveyi TaxID=669 RepID=UPI004067DB35